MVGAGGIAVTPRASSPSEGSAKTAALELGRYQIRVNSIHPGPIDTVMVQPESWGGFDMRPALAASMPLGRIGRPEEVAELVCYFASDASAYCTGSEFVIDGGFLAGPFNGARRATRNTAVDYRPGPMELRWDGPGRGGHRRGAQPRSRVCAACSRRRGARVVVNDLGVAINDTDRCGTGTGDETGRHRRGRDRGERRGRGGEHRQCGDASRAGAAIVQDRARRVRASRRRDQ